MRKLLAVALLLIACAPATDATKVASAVGLDGTEWTLTAIRGKEPVADSTITMKFEQESASGSAGCNQYSSRYTTSGSKLEFGLTSATKRGCLAPGINDQERAFLETLTKVAAFEATAERLVLQDAADVTLFAFARKRAM